MVERDQPEAENNHTERESATKTKITHSLFDLDLDHHTKPPKTASCRARSTLDGEGQLRANVAKLAKEWKIQGPAAKGCVKRTPRLLGYTIDCSGDCIVSQRMGERRERREGRERDRERREGRERERRERREGGEGGEKRTTDRSQPLL